MTTTHAGALADPELVALVLQGDVRAFEAIYARHSAPVFSLAMRVTAQHRAAEEATQDTFLTLWRSARSYDTQRGSLRTWLLCLVRNRSIDWLRRERRHNQDVQMDEILVGHLEASERTDEQFAIREDAREARRLLLGLPDEQRQVIDLAYFKGLTHSEIAAKTGIALGTVKGRQRLALTKMHRELSRHAAPAPAAALRSAAP